MNPVFWLIVIVIAVLIWFMLAPLYKPIGDHFKKMFDNSIKNMIDEEKETKEKI